MGGVTPLQRRSQCILQPQLTGQLSRGVRANKNWLSWLWYYISRRILSWLLVCAWNANELVKYRLLPSVIVDFVNKMHVSNSKQGRTEMNWVRRNNVWASIKYIMQNFYTTKRERSYSERSQCVDSSAGRLRDGLRAKNIPWKKQGPDYVCLCVVSTIAVLRLSFPIRTAITTFRIKELIFLQKNVLFHLCSASSPICNKETKLYSMVRL